MKGEGEEEKKKKNDNSNNNIHNIKDNDDDDADYKDDDDDNEHENENPYNDTESSNSNNTNSDYHSLINERSFFFQKTTLGGWGWGDFYNFQIQIIPSSLKPIFLVCPYPLLPPGLITVCLSPSHVTDWCVLRSLSRQHQLSKFY